MKKNNILKVTLVIVAVVALVLVAFGFNAFSLNAQATSAIDGDSSTETVNLGSLEVTSFSALLKGEKYTCNKEDVSSEATVSCSGDSGCPPTARCVFGSGGSGGICAYCLDSEGNRGDWVGSQCQGGDLIPMQA